MGRRLRDGRLETRRPALDEQDRGALNRLASNTDFQRVVARLKAARMAYAESMALERDDGYIHRYQGAMNALAAIEHDIEEAQRDPQPQHQPPTQF